MDDLIIIIIAILALYIGGKIIKGCLKQLVFLIFAAIVVGVIAAVKWGLI